jgi:endoglucanase
MYHHPIKPHMRSVVGLCSILVLLSLSMTIGFAQTVSIDQAGYTNAGPKFVFVASAADSFRVIDAVGGVQRFGGPLPVWKATDGATDLTVRRGDFSAFHAAGRYRIVVAPGDTSEPFGIADTIDNDVYRKSLKGFYFQRCGVALVSAAAGPFIHPACHTADGTFHASTDSSGVKHAATGGWHDAGDYGKYVVNAGITVGTLLMGYEYFPSRFGFDDLGIPESRNGVPDILDETRFELEWLLTMQRADGAVYFKLTPASFEGFVMPQSANATRYIYQVSTTATGDFVAVMARAARVYEAFDHAFAARCLSAALRGWTNLSATPSIVPSGGFRNPSGTSTGEYGDATDADERLWAAAELFVTTGDLTYGMYVEFNGGTGAFATTPWWGGVRPLADITYFKSNQAGTNETMRTMMKNDLIAYCNGQLANRNASGYHVVLLPGNYWWGSNGSALNTAMLLIMGYDATGTAVYRDAAADQLHYILGANALRLSYVTGIGTRSTLHPHHRPSESDGIAAPVPGLLAGGPDQGRDDAVLAARFTASTPPALCYVDTMPSYASNEVAINWNAPLVFVAGYFSSGAVTSVHDMVLGSGLPASLRLEQNYPNPFNPSTRIRYTIARPGLVSLTIYDALGREVQTLVSGMQDPGEHEVIFDASRCASGVYFCRAASGGAHASITLTVLK